MDEYKNSNIFHNLSKKEYKYMIDNYGENLTTKQDAILTQTIATTQDMLAYHLLAMK